LVTTEAVSVSQISKRYDATVALDQASFAVAAGEVHALLGENGAGKSTAVKMLSGLAQPDTGTIKIFGKVATLLRPQDAHALGVQTAFQEMTLIRDLTVTQNMLLTNQPVGMLGQLRRAASRRLVEEALTALELVDIDPDAEVRDLGLPVRQKIEIAKAIFRRPRVLLLDEATSTLSGRDLEWLFRRMRILKDAGVTILFISHRLREIRQMCDRLTILRNGRDVGTFTVGDVSDDEVVRRIIGRSLESAFPPKGPAGSSGKPALAVRDLTSGDVRGVSFELREGEILGVAALQGMGQLPLFLSLFGVEPMSEGHIKVAGRRVTLASPSDAINARIGISLLPEDRKSEGLFLGLSGRQNITLPVVQRFTRAGVISSRGEKRAVEQVLQALSVHPRALYKPCSSFSGGNQQKIAIAKWIMAESRIWLMFDPTRGVDVGTKHEIYLLMQRFVRAGGAVLLYSSEIVELVNVCDRVLVMYGGRITGEFSGADVSEENIMAAALGETQSLPAECAAS
jgi:ribose transport system ATP-binding protein